MTWWTIIITFLTIVCEVFADYCGDNIFCDAPYKCCEIKKGCCYDSMLHSSRHFRLQIWNMWYFWFLIIFMMMSCFGGCGYYRRRRLAMLTRPTHVPALRSTTVLEPAQRRCNGRSNEENGRHFNFFAYIGPGVNLPQPVSNLPPAYTEVISQPQPVNYPFNKVELPPYPGSDKPEDGHFAFASPSLPPHSPMLPPPPPREACLPPPYSEYTYSPPQPAMPPAAMSSQNAPFHDVTEQTPALPAERADSSTAANNTTNSNYH